MNINKRLRSRELITIILSLTLLGTLSAQHMGNHKHKRHAQKKRQQIRVEQQIEYKMDNIMKRTSRLMDAIQNMNYIDNVDSEDGVQINKRLIDMVHDMDKMARNIQKFTGHMDAATRDQEMMDDPKMGKHMKKMKEHMSNMMDDTVRVIAAMEKIQILNIKQ